ncbi:MAG: RES domain-containing protein [Betaproteobacteria bacterium]|nr:RES domain-containing protein [Betaproteobacteria bacterium]
MTPLPAPLGGTTLVAWRLDQKSHAATWDSGEGAWLYGGRWNSRGRRIVYCSIDPATAILEVAVHKGFKALDTVPHVLTSVVIAEPAAVHVVPPGVVPNANWLRPGVPGAGQQAFGDGLLSAYPFVLIPSAVSTHSWNLLFDIDVADTRYAMQAQEDFALDTRLHPPPA